MLDDYRNTIYCPKYSGIKEKKKKLLKKIRESHHRAVDMHPFISRNDSMYKDNFMEIYNYKCSYCGVSIDIIDRAYFEIDHFVHRQSKKFNGLRNAGNIDNLVLSCHDCNHDKGSFEIPDEKYIDLYPDEDQIKKTFIRDDQFYIKVSKEKREDTTVNEFYEKLHLGSEKNRIDYLLMSMIGLQEKIKGNSEVCSLLGQAIGILRRKRNFMARVYREQWK